MVKSQYEIDREANIARNKQLLEQLQLKQTVDGLGLPAKSTPAPKKSTAKPIQPLKPTKKKSPEPVAPRRQSARLRNVVDPDETPAKKRKREAEAEERRAREALEAEELERVTKRPRHHDLNLAELMDEDDADHQMLHSELKSIQSEARRIGDPTAFAFDDDKRDTRCIEELREQLKDLKIVSRAKVTQDRVYSSVYHPDVSKDLVFFGDKHGQLGIWDARAPAEEVADEDGDVSADDREGGRYHRLQVHWPATSKSSISCIKLDPLSAHNLYTSAYDCTIRKLSFETGQSTEIFATDELISSFDLTPGGQEMWISDGTGGLTHLDLRQPRKSHWYALSDQKIGCVSINPTHPNFVLTASNSRQLRVWDVRNLQAIDVSHQAPPTPPASSPPPDDSNSSVVFDGEVVKEFLESPRGTNTIRVDWRHDKSVSSAYWDPRGRSIVSTSYDDHIRLWDYGPSLFESKAKFPSSRPFSSITHNCQTGKWLTILRAQWSPNIDCYPHFTIANMNHALDIYSCKGDLIARLADKAKITAVQAVTCSHPNLVQRVASGNASGRCVLWAPSDS